MTLSPGARLVRFLRQYGPILRNDNMYDEHIRKSARRVGIRPLAFAHPVEAEVLALFRPGADRPQSVILTGTAGDGKSHLCGKIWSGFGGDEAECAKDDVYHVRPVELGGRTVTVHVVRDLTALPVIDPNRRYADKVQFLSSLCVKLLDASAEEVFRRKPERHPEGSA